jgi:hypothetical protein
MYWATYTLNILKSENNNFLDINKVLTGDKFFNDINGMIINVASKQLELGNYLKIQKNVIVNDMYAFNKILLKFDSKITKFLKLFQTSISDFPPYVYPPLILYYSWMRNVFSFRTEIYKQYTRRLKEFEDNETNLKEITVQNILQQTVAVQVSLQSNKYGKIIRLSPDYFMQLGY